jgi:hypothetical protein
MYTWNHVADYRLALASLWCGLEALFGDDERRMTAKLVARVSRWVPSVPEHKVRALYKVRCRAVHGSWLDEAQAKSAIGETENLLRLALVRCIETNSKTMPDWK